ncbi:MAG: S8 family serine peptidase [Actinomycetota bacterium]
MRERRWRRQTRVRTAVAACLLACLASVVPAVASPPGPAKGRPPRSNHIVLLRAEPPAGLDAASPDAAEYRRQLDHLEAGVLEATGVPETAVGYRYRTTLAGFSARLTAAEVERLRQHSDVASVAVDGVRVLRQPRPGGESSVGASAVAPAPAVTATTADDTGLGGQPADFLDLPEGLWARLGGPDHAGEDVIVGVIDGGIYPEHPSFADEPIAADGSRNYIGPAYGPPPARWRGTCQEGEAFPATSCNNKLIGARFFVDGWGATNVAEEDFLSPRDVDGHGTGMASIAAGNYGVDPSYEGNDLGLGVISGIAPRARLAHYKATWAVPVLDGTGFATDSDLAAAIDAAVADGVDIISLSIGSSVGATLRPTDQSTMLDPVSLALLRAYDAGVLTVAAAGNDGPEASTIESPGHTPWTISAGSSLLPTTFAATATVSAGPDGPAITAVGVSPTPALPATPLIDGEAAVAPGQDPARAARCASDSLDPALVKGKVVVCRPGSVLTASARLHELGAAGGLFWVLSRFRYVVDDVWLPSVVVSAADAEAIRQLIASTPNATVSFTAGTVSPSTTGDVVAGVSGRGPTLGSSSILKPDLLAPGGDMIIAHTPDVPPGARRLFDFAKAGLFRPLSGTSLSVPNTAGAAALLRALHPGLGPGELKSALMTTAQPDILEDSGGIPSVPVTAAEKGAGRIDPNRAAEPGLVVTETRERFEDYIAGQVPTRDPAQTTTEATDLNLPSIAFDPLIGPRSTQRTFTSVDAAPGTWTASFEGLAGIGAAVEPAQFTIEPGRSQTMRFTFDPGTVTPDAYVDGAVVLTNARDGRTVRLPVLLRPVAFEAPEQLNFGATQPDGSAPLMLPTGYDGQLTAVGYGFARPETRAGQTVGQDDPEEDLDRIAQPNPGVAVFDLEVPERAQILAAENRGASLGDPLADLDLYVFHDDENDGFDGDDLVDFSATAEPEALTFFSPDAGRYRISVRGFTAAPVVTFDLTTWVLADPSPDVPSDPVGPGLRVTGDPVAVTSGGIGALDLEWEGFDRPGVYVGLVTFHDPAVPSPPLWETVVAITRS